MKNISDSRSKEGRSVHGRLLQGRVCVLSLSRAAPPNRQKADTAEVIAQFITSRSLELLRGKSASRFLCIIFTFHLFTSDIGTYLIAFGHLCIVNQPHDTVRVLKRLRLKKILISRVDENSVLIFFCLFLPGALVRFSILECLFFLLNILLCTSAIKSDFLFVVFCNPASFCEIRIQICSVNIAKREAGTTTWCIFLFWVHFAEWTTWTCLLMSVLDMLSVCHAHPEDNNCLKRRNYLGLKCI